MCIVAELTFGVILFYQMKVCLLNNWLKDYNGILSKISWKEGVINKVLSRKVSTKLISSPRAVYFSTKKNRNLKEPLVTSHTIPVCETASTPFVSIGHPS